MDVVDRQLKAYNARDLETFVACYSDDVVVEDARGNAERAEVAGGSPRMPPAD